MKTLTHLERLEAESIHIIREIVAEAERPVMLYSVGKDSAVCLHLARKAFHPSPPPFPSSRCRVVGGENPRRRRRVSELVSSTEPGGSEHSASRTLRRFTWQIRQSKQIARGRGFDVPSSTHVTVCVRIRSAAR